MSDPTGNPIQVNATPTRDQIEAGLRQLVLVVGPLLTAAGYAGWAGKLNELLAIVGPVATIISFAWGQWETRRKSQKLTIVANAAPDSVAQVVGK